MGLNIKNERVCALAREAAAATGQTQTSVIETALEQLLAHHRIEQAAAHRKERIRTAVGELQQAWAASEVAHPFTTDDLYDENGLPA